MPSIIFIAGALVCRLENSILVEWVTLNNGLFVDNKFNITSVQMWKRIFSEIVDDYSIFLIFIPSLI